MERTEAYRALFGTTPESATQEHVDLLKGNTAPTDADLSHLSDDVVERINAFLDDAETFAEDEAHPERSSLLRSLAGKATRTPIIQPNLDESAPVDNASDSTVETREEEGPRSSTKRRRPTFGQRLAGGSGGNHSSDDAPIQQRKPVPREPTAEELATKAAWKAVRDEIDALFLARGRGDRTATDALFALSDRFSTDDPLHERTQRCVDLRMANPAFVSSAAYQREFVS